jgi:hypothetical protein
MVMNENNQLENDLETLKLKLDEQKIKFSKASKMKNYYFFWVAYQPAHSINYQVQSGQLLNIFQLKHHYSISLCKPVEFLFCTYLLQTAQASQVYSL